MLGLKVDADSGAAHMGLGLPDCIIRPFAFHHDIAAADFVAFMRKARQETRPAKTADTVGPGFG